MADPKRNVETTKNEDPKDSVIVAGPGAHEREHANDSKKSEKSQDNKG